MRNHRYLILLPTLFLWGCIAGKYDAPEADCEGEGPEVNITFSGLKELYGEAVMRITEPLVAEGYVVSDDRAGNFYGNLYLQDTPESPREGLRVDLDIRDAHLLFPVGQKVVLNLQGMYLGKSRGSYAVGGVYANAGGNLSVGRLPASQVKFHLFTGCDLPAKISPVKAGPEQLSDVMIGTLVQLDSLEVAVKDLCTSYAVRGESVTERMLQDCSGNTIILRNSGYADFQEVMLPRGSGTVTGVLEKYAGKYQLVVRDTSDVQLNSQRCGGMVLEECGEEETASLRFVRQLYSGEKTPLPEGIRVNATVISDRNSGTTPGTVAVVQDETGGIRCVFEGTHSLDRNDRVVLDLSGADLEVKGEGMSITGIAAERIISVAEGDAVTPADLSVSDDLSSYESTLVRLRHVQFDHDEHAYSGISLLTDCVDYAGVYTPEEAVFSGESLPSGKGDVTAVVSFKDGQPFLVLRDTADIDFKAEREDCMEGTDLMLTEYVEGSSYNKYVEIYNPAPHSVALRWYALGRDNNGDGDFGESYMLPLAGEIGPGETRVYAHTRALIYSGEIAGAAGTPMSFNGNDQVVLIRNGRVIDRVGVAGDHNWGADTTFRRKTGVAAPNPGYDESEWDMYPQDDVSGLGER
ncbi:DUF5689 domain-containing protein [Sinomicrobium soli]|uniref:DUF5689 domain-containing protein n=1 Tax=Sinomicrobium sp. N-1-3-6 TaxID=2219864 RepID=UPI000DCF2DA9|nr:DUF5689 domain-containing protein [Sinomicrobium sp. N-1-3-6]RAV27584.1 hypothetical protein DN748_18025 [Sinomicrobium sp. N-1-3-6]